MATNYDAWRSGEIADDGTHPGSPNYGHSVDAVDKRADAAWHAADLHDAMFGEWTLGGSRQRVVTVAEANANYRQWLAAQGGAA